MSLRNRLTLFCVTSAAVFAFIFGNEAEEINVPDLAILLGTLLGILTVQSSILFLVDVKYETTFNSVIAYGVLLRLLTNSASRPEEIIRFLEYASLGCVSTLRNGGGLSRSLS